MHKYILMLPYHAILKKVSLLSKKHKKRAVIPRLPTKISPLLKLNNL